MHTIFREARTSFAVDEAITLTVSVHGRTSPGIVRNQSLGFELPLAG